MNKREFFFFAALAVVISCAKETGYQEESEIVSSVEMVFTVSRDVEVQTRTHRLDNGDLWWSPADEIRIFNGSVASGKFTSQNSEMAATATFRGSLDAATGTIESGSGSAGFMALYPYDEKATCDGSSITFTLPSAQTGADDPFRNGMFPAIAQSNDLNLAFYNVCGGVKFSVAKSGILSVTIKSNGDEPIAGKIRVYFNEEGVPAFDVVDGVTEVVVNAPDSNGFEVGKDYYAILLPSSLSTGFSVVYNRDFQEAKFVTSNHIQVSRSRFGVLSQLDNNLEYKPVEGNIVFADPKLKERLVAKFDTNGDGELSYKEAAAVTSFEGAVTITTISSFDEFQFFTGLTRIPNECFKNWAKMESIVLPDSIISIGDSAFYGCSNLSKLTLPTSVLSIGGYAFYGCSKIESFVIPDSISRINDYTFYKCSSLESISLPNNLTYIGKDAFLYCSNMKRVYTSSLISWLNLHYENYGSHPFDFFSNEIDGHLFISGKELIDLSIPSVCTTIRNYAFRGCSGIKRVVLHDNISSIGEYAFEDCTSLEGINIPESVRKIGKYAFNNCRELREVLLPESVSEIGSSAFMKCVSLSAIDIPESISEISDGLFASCTGLSSINLPESVTKIGDMSFTGCTALTSIVLPESLTELVRMSFYSCTGLQSVIIPKNVTKISDSFARCSSLESITLLSVTPPSGRSNMFSDTNNSPIFVPAESIEAYKSAQYWSNYADRIQAIPSVPVPEAVDLGLSVKWASFNLGASSPEEYGDYYAWGETGHKDDYSWSIYKWCNGSAKTLTKYCNKSEYGYNGFTDDKTVLDPEDDAANVNLGSGWRMPTDSEWTELRENCIWIWTTQNGVNGRLVTASNGNSIFLPAVGNQYNTTPLGKYWSSSLYTDNPGGAWMVLISSGDVSRLGSSRCDGSWVRPVFEK